MFALATLHDLPGLDWEEPFESADSVADVDFMIVRMMEIHHLLMPGNKEGAGTTTDSGIV